MLNSSNPVVIFERDSWDKIMHANQLAQQLIQLKEIFTEMYFYDYRFKGKTDFPDIFHAAFSNNEMEQLQIEPDVIAAGNYIKLRETNDIFEAEEIRSLLKNHNESHLNAMIRIFKRLKEMV
jgi:hypothetical protein